MVVVSLKSVLRRNYEFNGIITSRRPSNTIILAYLYF